MYSTAVFWSFVVASTVCVHGQQSPSTRYKVAAIQQKMAQYAKSQSASGCADELNAGHPDLAIIEATKALSANKSNLDVLACRSKAWAEQARIQDAPRHEVFEMCRLANIIPFNLCVSNRLPLETPRLHPFGLGGFDSAVRAANSLGSLSRLLEEELSMSTSKDFKQTLDCADADLSELATARPNDPTVNALRKQVSALRSQHDADHYLEKK